MSLKTRGLCLLGAILFVSITLNAAATPFSENNQKSYLIGCNEGCNEETENKMQARCEQVCQCKLNKLKAKYTTEEYLNHITGEKSAPSYAKMSTEIDQITTDCVAETKP